MKWLIDTNVISEIRKPTPNKAAMEWLAKVPATQTYTASINIAELVFGAELLVDIVKRRELLDWIDRDIRNWFSGRVFETTESVLVRWRQITVESDRQRMPAPAVDLLIASVALENDLFVATRDIKPFVSVGLPTLNPFTGERFNGA